MGYKVGDKTKAICSRCEKIVDATFDKRVVDSLPRKHAEETRLVSVCDNCNEIVGIPISNPRKKKK